MRQLHQQRFPTADFRASTAMTDPTFESEERILHCARQYACLVAAFQYADAEFKQRFRVQLDDFLEQGGALARLVKRRRQHRLPGDILNSVVGRRDIKRTISASEAEAIRGYYSTPSIYHLPVLSGNEMAGLADCMEGWAQSKQLDCRSMIELLGWSDGMRSLVKVVGTNYTPLPLPEGTKPPLFKFLASKMLRG